MKDIRRGTNMRWTLMKPDKRLHALQNIYDYLDQQRLDCKEVTAADIVNFHKLPRVHSYTLAATMRYVHESRKAVYGFRVTGVRGFRKGGYPTKYTIELIKDI